MTATPALYRRIIRRERHSPRTAAMAIVAVAVVLVALYTAVEIALSLLGRPPLLLTPGAALAGLIALPTGPSPAAVVAGGALLGAIGLVLIVLALAPGKRARHRMASDKRAVVVDDGVIAAALAQRISDNTGSARENISVVVAHRVISVRVAPRDGVNIDHARLRAVVAQEIDAYALTPPLRTRVHPARGNESRGDQ